MEQRDSLRVAHAEEKKYEFVFQLSKTVRLHRLLEREAKQPEGKMGNKDKGAALFLLTVSPMKNSKQTTFTLDKRTKQLLTSGFWEITPTLNDSGAIMAVYREKYTAAMFRSL